MPDPATPAGPAPPEPMTATPPQPTKGETAACAVLLAVLGTAIPAATFAVVLTTILLVENLVPARSPGAISAILASAASAGATLLALRGLCAEMFSERGCHVVPLMGAAFLGAAAACAGGFMILDVYGAALLPSAFMAPIAVELGHRTAAKRARREAYTTCGYDLTGARKPTVCPECGTQRPEAECDAKACAPRPGPPTSG